ncbi:glyoxalase [Nonomuraea sp. NBC_01738]|uniref:glyoxalase n=1 Tax=Nonomuraea sp. NBC_01738 TaxID=2976003 RepID=UPI002E141819|nr:glyoxalase [Nonomuraea sp. NBC_01738]
MKLLAIHHVQLAAPEGSEDLLRAFYAGFLGLTEVPKPPELAKRGGCWFRGDSVEVHLGIEADFRPARKAHPAFLVDELPEGDVDLLFPGYRRVYVTDPAGNRIELLQPV